MHWKYIGVGSGIGKERGKKEKKTVTGEKPNIFLPHTAREWRRRHENENTIVEARVWLPDGVVHTIRITRKNPCVSASTPSATAFFRLNNILFMKKNTKLPPPNSITTKEKKNKTKQNEKTKHPLTQDKNNYDSRAVWKFCCATKMKRSKVPLPINALFFASKGTLVI